MQPKTSNGGYSWQSPEYTEHPHGFLWFMLLIGLTVAIATVVYLITGDMFGIIVVGLLGFIVAISAAHRPKLVNYKIDGNSISVGEKNYLLAAYKSFSGANEDHMVSITLAPLKRLQLPLTIYATPKQADEVMEALSLKLPHDDKVPDLVERLAHRLKF